MAGSELGLGLGIRKRKSDEEQDSDHVLALRGQRLYRPRRLQWPCDPFPSRPFSAHPRPLRTPVRSPSNGCMRAGCCLSLRRASTSTTGSLHSGSIHSCMNTWRSCSSRSRSSSAMILMSDPGFHLCDYEPGPGGRHAQVPMRMLPGAATARKPIGRAETHATASFGTLREMADRP